MYFLSPGTLVPDLACHPTLPLRLRRAADAAVVLVDSMVALGLQHVLHCREGESARVSLRPVMEEDGRVGRVECAILPPEAIPDDFEEIVAKDVRGPVDEAALPSRFLLGWMRGEVVAFHAREGRPLAHLSHLQLAWLCAWRTDEPDLAVLFPETMHDHWLAAFAEAEAECRLSEPDEEQVAAIERAAPLRARLDAERDEAAAWAAAEPRAAAALLSDLPASYSLLDRLVLARRWQSVLDGLDSNFKRLAPIVTLEEA